MVLNTYARTLGEGVIGVYVPALNIDWIILLSDIYDISFFGTYQNEIISVIDEYFSRGDKGNLFEKIRNIDNQNIQFDVYEKNERINQ